MRISSRTSTNNIQRQQRLDIAETMKRFRLSLKEIYKAQADWSPFFVLITAVFLILFIKGCEQPAHAEVTESQAVKILVGEASNQGFKGMVCVAEVLRHRNSTKGFYGLNAKHSAHEPRWVWIQAKKAWLASKTTNYTHGADHFENVLAFGCPSWVKSCVETFRYKAHVFYKEVA